MGKLNLSRRTFAKLSAATAATAVIGCAVPGAALAEDAEAPSRGSEIKRVRTCCRGCGKMECGVWVTVENGRAVRWRATSSVPVHGQLLHEIAVVLQAAYHPDRLYHPMKRTNPKGEEPGLAAHHLGRGHARPSARSSRRSRTSTAVSPSSTCAARPVSGCTAPTRSTSGCSTRPTPMWRPRSARARVASWPLDQLGRRRSWMALRRRAARVRAVGHRVRDLQLRRLLPQPGGPHERRRDAHLHRPAPVRLGQGGRLLAEPASPAPTARWRWPGSTSSSRRTSIDGSS